MASRKTILKGQEAIVSKEMLKDFILEDVHNFYINRHSFTLFVAGDPLADSDHGFETGVEFRMADRFERNINMLSSINPQRPILVVLSSNGGYWEEGMQMFGAILTCPNPVTVLGTKHCRSMSSIIPLAADRFLLRPPTKYMIHRGYYGIDGLDQEAETDDTERRKCNEMMLRIYAARLREQGAHRRSSDVRIREMLSRKFEKHIDVWFTANEAVHAGFADGIFDGDHKTLRATKINKDRRQRMMDVLNRDIKVEITVT
jgi:ATP-dependent protease ClpP protease subunit